MPLATQLSNVYTLHHSNYPESSFIITQSSISSAVPQQIPTESKAVSDKGFELILAKFIDAGFFIESAKNEVVGNEYILKDFRVRVGNISGINATFKGVVVEVEYAPSEIGSQSMPLIQEFIEHFFPGYSKNKPAVLVKHANLDNFLPLDVVSQYLDIFFSSQNRA